MELSAAVHNLHGYRIVIADIDIHIPTHGEASYPTVSHVRALLAPSFSHMKRPPRPDRIAPWPIASLDPVQGRGGPGFTRAVRPSWLLMCLIFHLGKDRCQDSGGRVGKTDCLIYPFGEETRQLPFCLKCRLLDNKHEDSLYRVAVYTVCRLSNYA